MIIDEKLKKQMHGNAFIHLENKMTDEEIGKREKPRLQNIMDFNESRWKDDYAANSFLRKRFRKETKKLKSAKNVSHGM